MNLPSHWPVWARVISRRRLPGDRGLGDTVEHVVGLVGMEDFAFWHYCVFGPTKVCLECPSNWNALYPYPKPS